MKSILVTIRKMLVGDGNDSSFDNDLITYINSVFAELAQMAAGLPQDFRIEDVTSTWDEYYKGPAISMIKDYIVLKTRIVFDPPASNSILEAFKSEADRLEWRINVAMDSQKEAI